MDVLIDRCLYLLLTLVLAYIVKETNKHYSYKTASRSNGCSTPSRYPHKDPTLGLDLFFNIVDSMKKGNTILSDMRRFDELGKTYQAKSWGSTILLYDGLGKYADNVYFRL